MHGEVGSEHFTRLSEGQHPESGVQLVKHQPARTYENEYGKEITSVEHRAGWDATFSAPKSVSLTALVGGDERVREAHRESFRVALGELERYTPGEHPQIGSCAVRISKGTVYKLPQAECWSCSAVDSQLPNSDTQPAALPGATVVRAVRARPASRIGGTPSTNRA